MWPEAPTASDGGLVRKRGAFFLNCLAEVIVQPTRKKSNFRPTVQDPLKSPRSMSSSHVFRDHGFKHTLLHRQ